MSESESDIPVEEVANGLCRLLVGLGDQSTEYLAEHIVSKDLVEPAFNPLNLTAVPSATPLPSSSQPKTQIQKTKAELVQTYLHLLLSFTSTPGYYGVDEEESEMTLGFWYLFQEALWSVEQPIPSSEEELFKREFGKDGNDSWAGGGDGSEREMMEVSRAVYARLVKVLREKVRWPPVGEKWHKGAHSESYFVPNVLWIIVHDRPSGQVPGVSCRLYDIFHPLLPR